MFLGGSDVGWGVLLYKDFAYCTLKSYYEVVNCILSILKYSFDLLTKFLGQFFTAKLAFVVKKGNQSLLAYSDRTLTSSRQTSKRLGQFQLTGHQGQLYTIRR